MGANSKIKIGIIGGTGLNNSEFFQTITKEISTEFGRPSSDLYIGKLDGVDCVLIKRHGKNHTVMPSLVNYRANIKALKNEGCTHILATTACGSLKEEMKPGDFVVLDTFIDRTFKRDTTFYDGKSTFQGILHLPMDQPFCNRTRDIIAKCAEEVCGSVHSKGTAVTIEGPRFSTVAESKMHRLMGADIVNMTLVPEVFLAKELGMCYASLAIVTDYDCWKEEKEPVGVEMVMASFRKSIDKAVAVLRKSVVEIASQDWDETITGLQEFVKSNVMVPKDH